MLLEKNLIEKKGRLDVPGRPSLYGTTLDFLRVFGLSSLDQLPSVEMLTFDIEENENEVNAEDNKETTEEKEENTAETLNIQNKTAENALCGG